MKRVQTYADKARAAAAVQAVNRYYLARQPAETRGASAPASVTARYLLLEQYADGTWGHMVDGYVRGLHGRDLGGYVLDVSGERDVPGRAATVLGRATTSYAALTRDATTSDAVVVEGRSR